MEVISPRSWLHSKRQEQFWNKSFASRDLMKPCYLAPPEGTMQL